MDVTFFFVCVFLLFGSNHVDTHESKNKLASRQNNCKLNFKKKPKLWNEQVEFAPCWPPRDFDLEMKTAKDGEEANMLSTSLSVRLRMQLSAEDEAHFGHQITCLSNIEKCFRNPKRKWPSCNTYCFLTYFYFLLLKVWLIATVSLDPFGLISHDKKNL